MTANGSADGLFLVRESSQVGDYALSVAHEGQPQHFVIMQYHAKPGCYFIDDGPIYEGCDRIIEYYRQQEDGLPCKLTSYCPRTVSEKRPQPLRPSGAKLVEVKQTEPRMARRQTGMKKSGGGDESSDDDGDDYNHMNTPVSVLCSPTSLIRIEFVGRLFHCA